MEVKLVVVGGDAKPGEIKLKLPAIIGRGRSASLTLPHPLVSRQHCELYESGGKLFVRDLGSLNGTFVGEEKIEEAALESGSLLTVGNVTFRPIYGEPAPPEEIEEIDFDMAEDVDSGSEPMEFEIVDDAEIEEIDETAPVAAAGLDEVVVVEEVEVEEAIEELGDVEEVAEVEEVADSEEIDPLDPPAGDLRQTIKAADIPTSDKPQSAKQPSPENTPTEKAPSEKPPDAPTPKPKGQDDAFLQFLDDDEEEEGSAGGDDDDLNAFLKGFK